VTKVRDVLEATQLNPPTRPPRSMARCALRSTASSASRNSPHLRGHTDVSGGGPFAEVHDFSFTDVQIKQQDPVQFRRGAFPRHGALQSSIARLIGLRTAHPALRRNEVQFFYFHPQLDATDGPHVSGYARTGARSLGSTGQVMCWRTWVRGRFRCTTYRAGRGTPRR
jgi:hypothetical protein